MSRFWYWPLEIPLITRPWNCPSTTSSCWWWYVRYGFISGPNVLVVKGHLFIFNDGDDKNEVTHLRWTMEILGRLSPPFESNTSINGSSLSFEDKCTWGLTAEDGCGSMGEMAFIWWDMELSKDKITYLLRKNPSWFGLDSFYLRTNIISDRQSNSEDHFTNWLTEGEPGQFEAATAFTTVENTYS